MIYQGFLKEERSNFIFRFSDCFTKVSLATDEFLSNPKKDSSSQAKKPLTLKGK